MRWIRQMVAIVAMAALASTVLVGCDQAPTAVDAAKEQIQQQTEQKQATVDEALNSAQATVTALASAVGGLESRVNGLQVNSDLQEIQRKLTNAIGQAGDKKKAAIEELSQKFDELISRIDTAAGKLPVGGAVQTELTELSSKLKDVQTNLNAAAASIEVSSSPTP